MDLHDSFMADIIEHPEEDAPRLVLADYLEDQGESERAELIRIQCQLASPLMKPCACFPSRWPGQLYTCQACSLRLREQELLGRDFGGWFPPEWPQFDRPNVTTKWRRGFVEVLRLPAEDWLEHADALVKAAPIREVHLTSLPVVALAGEDSNNTEWHYFSGHIRLGANLLPIDLPAQEAASRLLAHHWPRIRFTLPEATHAATASQ